MYMCIYIYIYIYIYYRTPAVYMLMLQYNIFITHGTMQCVIGVYIYHCTPAVYMLRLYNNIFIFHMCFTMVSSNIWSHHILIIVGHKSESRSVSTKKHNSNRPTTGYILSGGTAKLLTMPLFSVMINIINH